MNTNYYKDIVDLYVKAYKYNGWNFRITRTFKG